MNAQLSQREVPTQTALIIILAAAALLRVYMVNLDINILLDQGLLQDDAYYYYEIARNIVLYGFSSFDGINGTNGYHPIWQVFSTAVMSISDGEPASRIMLLLAAAFDMACLYIVFLILTRLSKRPSIALCGVIILAFHGTIIRTWFNGLETALSLFSLSLLFLQFLRMRDLEYIPSSQHILMGALGALCFLSRTDNAIIIIALYAWLYIPPALEANLKPGLIASSTLLIIVSPWLLWNFATFGSIVQISGQIKGGYWLIYEARAEQPLYVEMLAGIWAGLFPVGNVFKKIFIPGSAKYFYGYIFLIGLMITCFFFYKKDSDFKAAFKKLLPFICGVSALFLYHACVRQFIRGWYNAPVMLATVLLFCLVLDAVIRRYGKQVKHLDSILLIVITVSLLLAYSPYRYTKTPNKVEDDPRVAAALWLNDNTPEDTIVGAGNAGIVAFYTDRPVTNLDGVVNVKAHEAKLNNTLHQYIFESGITYLADHKGSIVHMCRDNDFYRCDLQATWNKSTQVVKVIPKE